MVIKSPKPRPGITFKIFANRVAVPPNPFDKPSYSVFPDMYPINPPVLLLIFVTFTSSSSQSDIATSPTTRPAKHPVAKAVGSSLRAFNILLSVSLNPASTVPKVSNHVNPSNSAPNVNPKVEVNPLINVWSNFVFVVSLSTFILLNLRFFTVTVPLLNPKSLSLASFDNVAKKPTPICSPTSNSDVWLTFTLEITGLSPIFKSVALL